MPRSPALLRPLSHRDYRWLLASLSWSLISEGLWLVAAVWQVVRLDGGPSDVSIVMSASALGLLVTVLIGGAIADRVPQRRILFTVEVLRFVTLGSAALLSALDLLTLWQLAGFALVGGLTGGMYFPAYSALLPSIVPEADLLPANGMEGLLRPVMQQALGPALAGVLVATIEPSAALGAAALASLSAGFCVLFVPPRAVRRDLETEDASGASTLSRVTRDIVEGFHYMVRTKWLLVTLCFASLLVLLVVGPMEVLVPFAIRDQTGGDAKDHALVLAAFGLGGALGSAIMGSVRLPRRYLTTMNLMWGFAVIPLAVFGFATHLAPMLIAALAVGALFNAPMVIWGTLLQRRVPPALLGRVSSLDFFVSLLLMPVSMAIAGPVGEAAGLAWTFSVAATAPVVIVLVVAFTTGLTRDEIEHPLDS